MDIVMHHSCTTDRPLSQSVSPSPDAVVLDVRSGEMGAIAEWVDAFTQVWLEPAVQLERLLALLSDNVTLRAPANPPVLHGNVRDTTALPFLESGEKTTPQTWRRLSRLFQGDFIGFAIWIN